MASIIYNKDILWEISEEVKHFDGWLKSLVRDLTDLMRQHDCTGLAAPQIGELKRVLVAKPYNDLDDHSNTHHYPIVMVNPMVETKWGIWTIFPEGCLSIPDKWRLVPRRRNVSISYQDINGNHYHLETKGFNTRILLHEIDHLNGKLITDYDISF